MKKILLVRPFDDSLKLVDFFRDRGFKDVIYPIFLFYYQEFLLINFEYDCVIVTSANAVNHYFVQNVSKNARIYVVGGASAEKLRDFGYENLIIAKNNAKSLKKIILERQKIGKIVYFCSNIIAFDFAKSLRFYGYEVKKINNYLIEPVKKLSKNIVKQIIAGDINLVAIYSKNTADILFNLLKKDNLLEYFNSIKLLCVSVKVANHCRFLGFENVEYDASLLMKL